VRPITLELSGFGPFRENTVVDFSDAQLFAIVGPTGHGKSTLIDAICFALYGSVPRHGERDIAPVVTLGAAEAKVSLTFAIGARELRATRVVRRKPDGVGATTRAVRLEELAADGSSETIAASKAEVQAAIGDLLGLTFDEFTKCVVLPQGQFAAFLHATSGERTAILSALLGLTRFDRMARLARERASVAKGAIAAQTAERERLGEVDAKTRAAAVRQHEALAALATDADAAIAADADFGARATAARRDHADAEAALAAVREIAIDDEVADAADALGAARTDHEQAEAVAATLQAELDGKPTTEALTLLLAAHDEIATNSERLAKSARVMEKIRANAEHAQAALIAARANEDAAQAASDEAGLAHAHTELRATLVVGEPCPVCTQVVKQAPPKGRSAALTQAKKTLTAARKARERGEKDAQEALSEMTRADALAEQLRLRNDELMVLVANEPPRADAVKLLARTQELAGARDLVRTTGAAVTTRERALSASEARFTKQRDGVVAAQLTPPPVDAGALDASWLALCEWAEVVASELAKRAAEAADAFRLADAERTAAIGELRGRAEELGATIRGAVLTDVIAAIVAAVTHAAHRVARIDEALERAGQLDREVKAARESESVASALGGLLDRSHFGQWMVEEALRGLVADASGVLRQLSGDQYSLAANAGGDLLVVDHANADETRSVRTLSGGETFQASLALALALAERVASLAPDGSNALESIFLDEGFGALDPETLDTVAATIEALASSERVVGIVTHVPELAERTPIRFRVRKVGSSATVTREET
jgi:exonuclease SbcC